MWAESQQNVHGNIFRLYVGKINTRNKCHKHIHGCTGGWFRSSADGSKPPSSVAGEIQGFTPAEASAQSMEMLLMSSGQWALTGKEVGAGSLCLFGFLQGIMKETEYICEATRLSEGWGTRKQLELHPCILVFTPCPQKLPSGGSAKAPVEQKHVSVQKKPSQNELCRFLQGATRVHSLI